MTTTTTMMNSTQGSFFTLGAYTDPGPLRYLYFVVVLLLYLLIVGANLLLILVICVNRSLHEPMYMFLLSLFANELYGSTGLFPLMLVQIPARVHTVPASFCFLQIFVIYTYASVEFSNLAVMSYDRYLAIVHPLQYRRRMAAGKVAALVALTWLYPLCGILLLVGLSGSLRLCGSLIRKVYCNNYSVVKLACSDTAVNNAYGLGFTCSLACLTFLILYSYARIFRVCLSGSPRTRQKAVGTCAPHLLALLNFSSGCFFEIVQSRFDMSGVPPAPRLFLSLYWLTCPPLLNPLLYGLNLAKVRAACRRLACS